MMQDHLNASVESFEDDKTIDLNFRESYDPDRIAENGFAIVGTEPLSLPRRVVCFLCGSAGLEKVIILNNLMQSSINIYYYLIFILLLCVLSVDSLCFML